MQCFKACETSDVYLTICMNTKNACRMIRLGLKMLFCRDPRINVQFGFATKDFKDFADQFAAEIPSILTKLPPSGPGKQA